MACVVIEKGHLSDFEVYMFFKDTDEPTYTFLITTIGGEMTLTTFDETGHVDFDMEEHHIEMLERHFPDL